MTSTSSLTPNFSRELDIESMLSAPLVAASKANVVMVTGQTRFLLEYCFTKEADDVYKPVMIDMSMKRSVLDPTKKQGEPGWIRFEELHFSIPLMCIVPINSLALDKIAIDFSMEITSAIGKDVSSSNSTDNQIIDKSARLNGRIGGAADPGADRSSKHYKSEMSNHLKVNLSASPLPLPTGVLTILDLYTKAIQPIPHPSEPSNTSATADQTEHS